MQTSGIMLLVAHLAVWGAFGLARWYASRFAKRNTAALASTSESFTAPHSRLLVAVHGIAFCLMYNQIGVATFGGPASMWTDSLPLAGASLIAIAASLMAWAVLHFSSWRFRAQLDEGHQLATTGPFRFFRHPIYMGLNLFALGTALWLPTPLTWIAVVAMIIGSDLRGRSEEKLLKTAFGKTYEDYCTHAYRFIPFVY